MGNIIDEMLRSGQLSLAQHLAAEIFLGKAAEAGLWPVGPDISLIATEYRGQHVDQLLPRVSFGGLLRHVKNSAGDRAMEAIRAVIVRDSDIRSDPEMMKALRQGLDAVAMMTPESADPLRHIRKGGMKPPPND